MRSLTSVFVFVFVFVVLFVASCDGTATQYVLRIDADDTLLVRAYQLRVVVFDDLDTVRLDRVVNLVAPPVEVSLPTDVPISPEGGDASRGFRVEAELLASDGSRLGLQRVDVGGFVPDELFVLHIHFGAECEARRCAPTETCLSGACVPAEIPAGQQLAPAGDITRWCREDHCFEHPLPLGADFSGSCLYTDARGFVVTGRAEVVHLEEGVANVETLDAVLTDVECWGDGEAVGITSGDVYERRNGTWTRLPVEVPRGASFQGVARLESGDVWIVGRDTGTWVRRPGAAFERLADPGVLLNDISAVHSGGGGSVWLGGDGLYRYSEERGVEQLSDLSEPNAPRRIESLVDTGRGRLVVGANSFNPGREWAVEAGGWSESGQPCADLGVTDSGDVVCVYQATLKHQVDGTNFEAITVDPASTDTLNRRFATVSTFGETVLIGSRDYQLYLGLVDRPLRSVLERQTDYDLNALASGIHGTAVVGPSGTLLERQPSATWSRAQVTFEGGAEELLDVCMDGTRGTAVGRDGAVLERSLELPRWSQVPTPTEVDLYATAPGYAGGADGVLLLRVDGQWTLHPASGLAGGIIMDLEVLADGRVFAVVNSAAAGVLYELFDDRAEERLRTSEPIGGIRGEHELYVARADAFCVLDDRGCEDITPSVPGARDLILGPDGPAYVLGRRFSRFDPSRTFDERLQALDVVPTQVAETTDGTIVMLLQHAAIAHLRTGE